jgi:hypothetical protein
MTRIVASMLLLIAVVLNSCARRNVITTVSDGPCEIEGTVVYEDGRPANHSTVLAFPTDRGMAAKVPSADTDELGHFHIKHLWLGL